MFNDRESDLFILRLQVESNIIEKEKEDHLQNLTCSICQDITVGPHRCHPCNHIFCAWCLQEMHRRSFEQIDCALCRRHIQQETFCRGNRQGWKITNCCFYNFLVFIIVRLFYYYINQETACCTSQTLNSGIFESQ